MNVKKYTAPTMPEAMKIVRNELGNDAIILNSKVVYTGGFLGLFKKKNIEVIAAVDNQPQMPLKPVIKEKVKKIDNSIRKEQVTNIVQDVKVESNSKENEILKELEGLRKLVQNVSMENRSTKDYPEPLQIAYQTLREQEIKVTIIEKIMKSLLERWYLTNCQADEKTIYQWLREEMLKLIEKNNFGGVSFQKKFVNVVGPTGVGKTTTLAKLAAISVLKYKKRVAFITTDTYRIAAIEQLKTYATILGVPIEVCYNINDFQKATERFNDYDVILIDTAGRNFRNGQYVKELQKIIDFNHNMETFLVLALTSKEKDMLDIFEQFSLINIDKLIFTKVDETSQYGSILNFIYQQNIGVAYLTNGQNVPDDIVEANANVIVNTILGVE